VRQTISGMVVGGHGGGAVFPVMGRTGGSTLSCLICLSIGAFVIGRTISRTFPCNPYKLFGFSCLQPL
jgi:hypothetical protein